MCAKPTGFLEYDRQDPPKRAVEDRVDDYREVEETLPQSRLVEQASRCMDCGIPFCHAYGCPVVNLIPDFNDMVYRGQWRRALDLLHSTNNFPEVTGRVCPAPCETSCTLGINQPPVTIRQIELQIVERGWRSGWIRPEPAPRRTGKRVAIVGSGPAGLAAAQQLARMGHDVVVFEKADRIGGILRYGIPDFKMEKWVLDRRLDQMREEGVTFEAGVDVGVDLSIRYLQRSFDAVLLAGGARVARVLNVPGHELGGIVLAMDFLTQQNCLNAGDTIPPEDRINAHGRNVVVIGGGDTGSDCVGTSVRQGAKSVTQVEILPKPPPMRDDSTPWPEWPYQLRTSSSHEEGCERHWNVQTKRFLGKNGAVSAIDACRIEWTVDEKTGRRTFEEVSDSEFTIPAELVLLAMGFTMEGNQGILQGFGVDTEEGGQAVLDERFMSSVPGVFVAGDLSKGASLVVRAIADGRYAADGITEYLRNADTAG